MYTKNIYFAGGSFYELQELFSRVKGVTATKTGYINSLAAYPCHKDILKGKTGAAMGIEAEYDPKKIDLSTLLDILCTVIDPYIKNGQKNMQRSGVYYSEGEDEAVVQLYMNFIKSRHRSLPITPFSAVKSFDSMLTATRRCYMEALPLVNFYPAEEMHQYYLRKNPSTKTFIDFMRLRELEIITSV
ncbi:peptide-methionine (S)-S-oxide reductase [Pectinatus haikarae]|uniref:peptide-methionine (S)-S-oxide reductase n=1 Tax=Pectinatus haikarae TaxID=349096 RepID=A0ABT9Y457_9FIRM|nr:peptide-methionine (S)-S-oxide reductase [Pectinatus haikarae]MDQ0202615.1 methionine-S-sulfoxide reductase [Pectinatus haikarae]